MASKKLVINRCPRHGYWAVTIEDEDGGYRVTPSKCCGRWDEVKAFSMSESDWRDLAAEAMKAARASKVIDVTEKARG